MDKDASALNTFLNESVGYTEELLGILSHCVNHVDVKVLEVLVPLGIFFATHIENMGNPLFYQILGFEG